MLAKIRDILIITKPDDAKLYYKLLNDGSQFGLNISYAIQSKPRGLAEAFIIGEKFINKDSVCMILGDNIFYGQGFTDQLSKVCSNKKGATVFSYFVKKPYEFGVVELDQFSNPISIEEKPEILKSNLAVTGLYFYDNNVIEIAKSIKPSKRGELEINSINKVYLNQKKLKVEKLGRGFVWLDAGTFETFINASQLIETIENQQNCKIACLEEIAFYNNWIDVNDIYNYAITMQSSKYGQYLLNLVKQKTN
jgi:glucose-1-phosphate thymidylyltransferase